MGILLIIFSIIFVFLVYVIYKSNIFHKIQVEIENIPEMHVAYRTFIGPYHKAYLENAKIEKVFNDARKGEDFSKTPCFGVYYDNPKDTPKEKCRSIIGKILPKVANELVNEELLQSNGIKYTDITIGKAAVIHYPLDSLISLYTGMFRSYPMLNKWIQDHKEEGFESNFIELYGYTPNSVTFVAPLGKRSEELAQFPQ